MTHFKCFNRTWSSHKTVDKGKLLLIFLSKTLVSSYRTCKLNLLMRIRPKLIMAIVIKLQFNQDQWQLTLLFMLDQNKQVNLSQGKDKGRIVLARKAQIVRWSVELELMINYLHMEVIQYRNERSFSLQQLISKL